VRAYQNIVNGTAIGANPQPGIKNSGASGTKLWNNLITRTDNAVVIEDGDSGHSLNVELRNGIMANNRDWGLMLRAGNTLAAFDGNLFYNNESGSVSGASMSPANIEVDPKFVNPGFDFHLQADSPCIDTGANVGLLEDIEGTPIPQGQGVDIGPYEYIGEIMATHSIDVILRVLELADFAMGATPADLGVQRTKTGTYSITATAIGGFALPITLSVSGLPTGATFSFSKNPIVPGETSIFSITPAANTPLGNFTLSFTGNG
jgi:hypothetical protein